MLILPFKCFCKSPRNAYRNVGFRLDSIDSLKTAILSAKYFKSFKQGSWISSLRTFAWSPRVLERREAWFREGAVKGGLFWTMKADLLSYAKEMGCYTGCPYDQETDDDLDDVLEIKGS